jgi:hypothetical protein
MGRAWPAENTAPTLIIHGAHDPAVPVAWARRAHERPPGGNLPVGERETGRLSGGGRWGTGPLIIWSRLVGGGKMTCRLALLGDYEPVGSGPHHSNE